MTEAQAKAAATGKWWTLSPTMRISMGLVSLLIGLLMILDLVLKILPDQRAMTMELREQVSVFLAMDVRRALNENQRDPHLDQRLADMIAQSKDIVSVAVRRDSGAIFAQTPLHAQAWDAPPLGASTLNAIVVPLNAGALRWGQLEVAFRSPWPATLAGWLKQPTVQLVITLSSASFVAFYLYLRRVLQHLDPSKAIPERVRVAFDTLTEGLLVLDVEGKILMANSAFRTCHPLAEGVLLGRSVNELDWLIKGLREAPDLAPPWTRALSMTEPILGIELDLTHVGGESRRALVNCSAVRDVSGHARGCLVTLADVTALDHANNQLRIAMAELQMLANCDPMTGCFNRRAFFAKSEPMLAHALKTGEPLSCFMTDIDKFKLVNDTHGHAIGDVVIKKVASILKEAMRPEDVLCRYGGEEFCALMPGLDQDEAGRVADRIRAVLEREVGPSVESVPNMRVTSSFGVAQLGAGQVSTILQLIERADQGLYAAKEAGRNQVQCIDWARQTQ